MMIVASKYEVKKAYVFNYVMSRHSIVPKMELKVIIISDQFCQLHKLNNLWVTKML